MEFSKRSREVALEITRAISESLGLEPNYIHDAMNMDRGIQMLAANYYQPCPQPELAIGIPHHTDHGLVTLLIQNKMNGLQVEHNGKWLTVDGPALVKKTPCATKFCATKHYSSRKVTFRDKTKNIVAQNLARPNFARRKTFRRAK
ncbi:unnamed protein product [Prunus brigantina]